MFIDLKVLRYKNPAHTYPKNSMNCLYLMDFMFFKPDPVSGVGEITSLCSVNMSRQLSRRASAQVRDQSQKLGLKRKIIFFVL